MKGDFSRLTFDPHKNYNSVRMQQGRVQLDADWNEQADILRYHLRREIEDFIGQHGTPVSREDQNNFRIEAQHNDLVIYPGRYYVAGHMVENHHPEPIRFSEQPDYPGAELPTEPGTYILYLDVWERLVTALEDPAIREVALGGPDTAARARTVWQVRWQRLDGASHIWNEVSEEAYRAFANWQPTNRVPLSSAHLAPQIAGGLTIHDNRLYRVEVHQGGARQNATFKWSRDNGAIAARIQAAGNGAIVLDEIDSDPLRSFPPGTCVEVLTWDDIQRSEPGVLVQVIDVQDDTLIVRDESDLVPPDAALVRRWDSPGEVQPDDDRVLELEHGLSVIFSGGEHVNAGDYWLIAARAMTGSVEWPRDADGQFLAREAHGTRHYFAPLAVANLNDDGEWLADNVVSLRRPFVRLTDLGDYLNESIDRLQRDTERDPHHYGDLTIEGSLAVRADLTVRRLGVGEVDMADEEGGGIMRVGGNAAVYGNFSARSDALVMGSLSVGSIRSRDADSLRVEGGLAVQAQRVRRSQFMLDEHPPNSILWGVFVQNDPRLIILWKDGDGNLAWTALNGEAGPPPALD